LSGVDLAARLTEDIQRVATDGHLRVMYRGQGGGGGPQIVIQRPAGAVDSAPSADRQPIMVRMQPPPPIEEARWLAPGIAFVRLNLFPGEADVTEAVRQFMVTHADADTIIFDLRTHMGGGLDEMDVIFPWLFSTPTRLVTMAARRSVDEAGGSPVGDGPTMRRVQGDPNFVTREHWVTPGTDARLFDARVFVLTSGFTGSAAEHFALAVKHTGRGTLIGSATYGANHFGGEQDLGGGFAAFIPVGRTYDPVTGADWESVGVAPDIDVAPEAALIEALTRSGVSPEEAARLSAEVAPRGPMTSPRRHDG
jgi:C-terminal processing protease CtpA/Prc